MRGISMTYDIVTPESAEYGDVAETGFAAPGGWTFPVRDEDGEVMSARKAGEGQPVWDETDVDEDEDVLEEAARFITQYGGVNAGGGPTSDSYYTMDSEEDFQTGARKSYGFHLEGFSKDELRELHDLLR